MTKTKLDEILKTRKLPDTEKMVLYYIFKNPEKRPPLKEIAHDLGWTYTKTKATVNRLLKKQILVEIPRHFVFM